MKGTRIMFPTPNQVSVESYEVPDQAPSDGLLIRTLASGVSPGTELIVFTGKHSALSNPNATWPRFPFEPGYCSVGEVIDVGAEVSGCSVGDRVCTRLAHASIVQAKPTTTNPVVKMPNNVSDVEGALAPMASISMNGVRLAQIELGETVLVAGLGLIGMFASQLSLIAGAGDVVAADFLSSRRDLAASVGITHTVDGSKEATKQVLQELTEGRGAEVVIDATGSPKAAPGLMEWARFMGRYVVLGSPHGTVEMDLYALIHRQCLRVIGAHEMSAGRIETPSPRWTRQENLRVVLNLISQGRLHIKELVTHVAAPAEAPSLYPQLVKAPAESLGVVFDWTQL